MNYLSLKKYNLYSESFGSLLYFDTKIDEDFPVISGKNPSGIKWLPMGKSYTATQFRYFLIVFCSAISLSSFFEWGSIFISVLYGVMIYKINVCYPQLTDIWNKANKK